MAQARRPVRNDARDWMRAVKACATAALSCAFYVMLCVVLVPAAARAQLHANPASPPQMREACPGLVASAPVEGRAGLRRVALQSGEVRITFAGHATFLIESPQGVRIATDYNDFVRPPVLPDIATMNHAHTTHYTDAPDPAIKYVLRGWTPDGSPARHDLQYKDVHVRNVVTNIRTFLGETERNGNSIFVFEMAGLCIGHLGHLHHTLTQAQLDEIGRLDVVMVPVDGSYTLDLDGMIDVLRAMKARLMLPMHYFNRVTLARFLARSRETWPVETADVPSLIVSRATLPSTPKVVVLPGR